MSFMRKVVVCMAAAVIAAASPAAIARAQTAEGQPTEKVRVAVLAPGALFWLHAIAKDQGFYAAHGIEVEDLVAGTSPALLQAVSSGSVEAGISVADLTMRAIDQGAPVVISGAVLGKSILRFIGAKGVETAADIGARPVTAGGVQGGTANLLRFLMSEQCLDGKAAQLVAMTNSRDRLVAMQNGQVGGSLLIAPFDSLAQADGMKVLADYKQDYLQTPLILNSDWAKANRRAAIGFTQANRDASDWIYDPQNKDEAIRILAQFTKVDPAVAAQSYAFVVEEQQAIGKGLVVTAASLENLLKISAAVGAGAESDKPFDLARYYDASFLAGQ